jgi:hypothetical protein
VGFHTVEARAFDDVDNMGKTTRSVNIQTPASAVGVQWMSPKGDTVISRGGAFPPVSITLLRVSDVARADIIATHSLTGHRTILTSILHPASENYQSSWSGISVPGTYLLSVETVGASGQTRRLGDAIKVYVQ